MSNPKQIRYTPGNAPINPAGLEQFVKQELTKISEALKLIVARLPTEPSE